MKMNYITSVCLALLNFFSTFIRWVVFRIECKLNEHGTMNWKWMIKFISGWKKKLEMAIHSSLSYLNLFFSLFQLIFDDYWYCGCCVFFLVGCCCYAMIFPVHLFIIIHFHCACMKHERRKKNQGELIFFSTITIVLCNHCCCCSMLFNVVQCCLSVSKNGEF